MPTKKLTDLFVERAKPPENGRVEYFNSSFGGLALRVTKNAHKSWSLHYRMGGRLRRLTLGDYPAIKPKHARRKAQDALERVRDGIDPAEEKRARREADAQGGQGDDVSTAVQDYLARLERNIAPSTYREAKRILERDVLKTLGKRSLAGITRGDVNRLVDGIISRGAQFTPTACWPGCGHFSIGP